MSDHIASQHDGRFEYLVREREDAELLLARASLARRQTELLAALTAGGPVPAGFDAEQVRVQTEGLAAKRRDTVAHLAPELAAILGADYGPLFLRYAAGHPQTGGYRADARAFAEWALGTDPAADRRRALRHWLRPGGSRWNRLLAGRRH
ncbi:hypothetical protein GCM10023235_53070 [Kitasatospora terrestris]|uniref:SCO6045-like C-terminal domain-containing protein n=1 Tax=Kitasatospora terrestris TaxID=258051 RepID=A0ABP9E4F0_9ACTN